MSEPTETVENQEEMAADQQKPKKKPKLTKQEKKALAKQLVLDKKREAEEAKRQIKRDYLIREEKYTEMNRKKLESGWRNMLLDIKIPILKKEFRYAMNNFERMVDAKDFKISLLMDELDEGDEQYELNLRSHLGNIEQTIMLFHEQLNLIKTKYDDDLNELIKEANNASDFLSNRKRTNDEFIKMMLYGLDVESKHEIKNIRSEYMSKINAESTWYTSLYMAKKFELQSWFENTWKHYNDTLSEYLKMTKERKKNYDKIKDYDSQMRKLMDSQVRQIGELYEKKKILKETQELERKDLQDIEYDMIEERNYFADAFRILKGRLITNEKNDHNKLVDLTETSNGIIKNLRQIKIEGEKVLRLMSLSRKYETQKEKVMPFPAMIDQKIAVKSSSKRIEFTEIVLPKGLLPFWQKFALADSTRHVLNEEREHLKRENVFLRNKIKKYCRDAACRCFFPSVKAINDAKNIKVLKKPGKKVTVANSQ